jgi:S-DNA-T family DNA segregation ATPase FtsK/SpoIIIE
MPNRSKSQHKYESETRNDWLDRLARFNEHFGRFIRDALGVFLIAAALLSILALGGYTKGLLLSPWASLLSSQFGWGSYLVAIAFGYGGFVLLRRNEIAVRWGRLIALELASLLTLGLLAAVKGNDIFRAEAGKDGGLIGWGLLTLFRQAGDLWGTLLLFLLWLLMVMTGFGLWAVVERWLLKLAGETPPVEIAIHPIVPNEAPVEKPESRRPAHKKTVNPLPPEFRKSLRAADHQDKKPAAPRERDELLPSLNILLADQNTRPDERTINQTAGMIEKTLAEFGIVATVIGFRVGPTVTQFAVQPGFMKRAGNTEEEAQQIKVRVAQIASLQKDLALALSAERLRIEAPVPGKPYVGIEVPNTHTPLCVCVPF